MKVVLEAPLAASRFVIVVALTASPFVGAGGQQLIDSARAELKVRIGDASPALTARRAALDVSRARRAATGHLPPAILSGEIEEVPNAINLLAAQSMRLALSRELVPRSRRIAERAIADLDVQRSALEVEIAQRVIDATVDQLVVRAAGSAAIASRLASEDSLLRGAEEALEARFAVADARYVDVLRLRTERLRVVNDGQRAFADYRVARGQLLRLAPTLDTVLRPLVDFAITREGERLAAGAWPSLPPLDSVAAASGARRLSMLAVERAAAARRLTSAELRPTLSPSLGIQRFTESTQGSAVGLTAGASLSLPFTARAGNQARVALADRELTLARAEGTATDAALMAALSLAAERYEIARSLLASYDATLLRGAREEREAALAAYRTGGLSLLELLDFERALAQAEVSRIRSRIEAAQALTEYLTTAIIALEAGGPR